MSGFICFDAKQTLILRLKTVFKMSDYLKQNANYLDENTHLIIHGYCHTQLPSKIIPNEIIHLIILFVDDHFMLTQGAFQWYINNELLHKMKNANRKQKFASHAFKIAELNWLLEAYPNGDKDADQGFFKIYVKLLPLPTDWNHIMARQRIQCTETIKKISDDHTVDEDDDIRFLIGVNLFFLYDYYYYNDM